MINATENFHQGRFAGAVQADQGVDFAGPAGKGDIVERAGLEKALADAGHLDPFAHCAGLR